MMMMMIMMMMMSVQQLVAVKAQLFVPTGHRKHAESRRVGLATIMMMMVMMMMMVAVMTTTTMMMVMSAHQLVAKWVQLFVLT